MSVRVALFGAGEWGGLLAGVLADLPGVELAVVCDPDTARAARIAGPLGSSSAGDAAAIMEDASVDAIVVASPEDVHASQAESALRSGKHVLVEKPVALTSEDALRLVNVVSETGRVLMPGHILRFVPAYAAIHEQLSDHTRVHSVFARRNVPVSRFSAHQRTHTALMSLAHDLDLILWYLGGQEPERAYAVERRTVPGKGNPDVFWGIIEFSGGTVACVESLWTIPSGGSRYVDVELELSTDEGFMTVRNPDDAVTFVRDDKTSHPAVTLDLEAGGHRFGAVREELLHFAALVRGEAERPLVTIDDAAKVIALAEMLIRSAQHGIPATAAGRPSTADRSDRSKGVPNRG
jgi:UDP-N-acetylglucosamine 3-dehydrogenase